MSVENLRVGKPYTVPPSCNHTETEHLEVSGTWKYPDVYEQTSSYR